MTIVDVEAAKTVDELKEVYYRYEKMFAKDKRFIAAVNKKNAELTKAA